MIAPALALVSFAWLALLLTSPIGPTSFAALIYAVGSVLCHQIPERSFHLGAFQIPVCARCLGIYAGFALTACVHVAGTRLSPTDRPRAVTPSMARLVCAAAALPTAVTLGLEWGGMWQGSNIVRAIAGVALGAGVAFVVMSAVATLHYSSCERRRPTAPSHLPPHI